MKTPVRFKFFLSGFISLVLILAAGLFALHLLTKEMSAVRQSTSDATKIGKLTDRIEYLNSNIGFQVFLFSQSSSLLRLRNVLTDHAKIAEYLDQLEALIQHDKAGLRHIQNLRRNYQAEKSIVEGFQFLKGAEGENRGTRLYRQFLTIHSLSRAEIRDLNALHMVGVEEDIESLYAAGTRFRWLAFGVLFISIILIVGLIFYYELVFLRPLRKISGTIKKMAGSNFNFEVPELYQDELGEINLALSTAAQRVREKIEQERSLNEKLKEANLELENFSYIASHDLKEPLRHMQMYLQLIEREYLGELSAEAKEQFEVVTRACKRMNSMIAGLEVLYKLDGRTAKLRPVDLRQSVDSALSNLKTTIDERKAIVNIGDLPIVLGIESQLTDLFQNLISNAIKYNRSKQARIEIFCQPSEALAQCVVGIRDNGIGIDKVHGARIFQIFARLHSQDKFPGTGIGLAICKKIVEQHGGRIWVNPNPNGGSTFYFSLRLSENFKKTA